ncbi:MAG: DUF6527 family protein [Kofleriaceae bacterium]
MTESAELLAEGMSPAAVAKLTEPHGIRWWCSGCQSAHRVPLVPAEPNGWTWNGSLVRPTLTPSVLVFSHTQLNAAGRALIEAAGDGPMPEITDEHREETPRCHSFITDGWIDYLADSTHELAGQKVPLTLISSDDR